MLRFFRRRHTAPPTAIGTSLADHPELQIRNLLDDPRLRRSMGLPPLTTPAWPAPVDGALLDRDLLERTAA